MSLELTKWIKPDADELVVRYLVVSGNPIAGFRFNGPFVGEAEAESWVEDQDFEDAEWWIAPQKGPL